MSSAAKSALRKERRALPAIADKCPVRRTLHGQAIIETAAV